MNTTGSEGEGHGLQDATVAVASGEIAQGDLESPATEGLDLDLMVKRDPESLMMVGLNLDLARSVGLEALLREYQITFADFKPEFGTNEYNLRIRFSSKEGFLRFLSMMADGRELSEERPFFLRRVEDADLVRDAVKATQQ